MITCKQIEEMMSLYIDQQLSDTEVLTFEAHIENCISCKQQLAMLQQIIEQCNNLEEEPLPDEFKQQLHQKLIQVQTKRRIAPKTPPWYLNWKTYSGLAAGVLIMFVMKTQIFDNGLLLANKAEEAYVYGIVLEKEEPQMSMSMTTLESAESAQIQLQEIEPGDAGQFSMQHDAMPESKSDGMMSTHSTEAIEPEDRQVIQVQDDFKIGIYEGRAELIIHQYSMTMSREQVQKFTTALADVSFEIQYKQFDETLIIGVVKHHTQDISDIIKGEVGLEKDSHKIHQDVTEQYHMLIERYYQLRQEETLEKETDTDKLKQIKHEIRVLENDIGKSIFKINIE